MAVFFGQAVVLSFQDRVLGDGDEVERVAGDLGDVGMAEFSDVRVLDTLTVGGASLVRDLRVSYWRLELFLLIKLSESCTEIYLAQPRLASKILW